MIFVPYCRSLLDGKRTRCIFLPMKHLSAILLFSIITILNCAGPKQDDLSGLLLLLGAGGPSNSFHCGQTVANPVDAGFTVTTNTYISNANNDTFVTAMGGNNCESATLTDNDNGTVTDTANHFLWTLCTGYNPSGTILKYDYTSSDCNAGGVTADDINITRAQAESFCNSLTFAGHSDWVLPDAIQLFSLYSTTTPFALSSFGSKKSVARVGGAWSTTQTTSSHSIVNAYASATQRFFTTTASSNNVSSFICVAKI